MNEKRDPVPDEGISLLQFLYREEFTPLAAQMMTEFGTMKYARGACQGNAKQLEYIDQEYQAPIARIIDAEIEESIAAFGCRTGALKNESRSSLVIVRTQE